MGLFHLLTVNDITLCLPAPVWLLYLLSVPTVPTVSTTVCLLHAYCCYPRVLTVPTVHAQCAYCINCTRTCPVRYCANCTVHTTSSVPTMLTVPSVLTMPTMQ